MSKGPKSSLRTPHNLFEQGTAHRTNHVLPVRTSCGLSPSSAFKHRAPRSLANVRAGPCTAPLGLEPKAALRFPAAVNAMTRHMPMVKSINHGESQQAIVRTDDCLFPLSLVEARSAHNRTENHIHIFGAICGNDNCHGSRTIFSPESRQQGDIVSPVTRKFTGSRLNWQGSQPRQSPHLQNNRRSHHDDTPLSRRRSRNDEESSRRSQKAPSVLRTPEWRDVSPRRSTTAPPPLRSVVNTNSHGSRHEGSVHSDQELARRLRRVVDLERHMCAIVQRAEGKALRDEDLDFCSPFTVEILEARVSLKLPLPSITPYNGTSDSADHIHGFELHMVFHGASDAAK
ncbi:hypothetical protein Taro_003011 [Colocasia esculenta]|uniref:Uncharacterized protein n=1 Tax=Colocasia esculenta TaxID=4460 RepID=A0A843TQJ2_COLES|nr:hypothetical protein [Colocasia esculenta]